MQILLLLSAALTVYWLTLAARQARQESRLRLRLRRIREMGEAAAREDPALQAPLFVRLLGPLAAQLTRLTSRYAPPGLKDQVRQLLTLAGLARRVSSEEVLACQVILAVTGAGLALHLTRGSLLRPGPLFFLLAALGAYLPILGLRRCIALRQKRILRDLPYVLDLLVVSVESGLGLDASIARVTRKVKSPLSQEFAQTAHEVRVGRARRDALRDMKDRIGMEEVGYFVAALIQADRMGLRMGQVLRVQADQARMNRRMRAREQAMKLPVKLVLPVALLIFPAVALVCAGPAFLQLLKVLE